MKHTVNTTTAPVCPILAAAGFTAVPVATADAAVKQHKVAAPITMLNGKNVKKLKVSANEVTMLRKAGMIMADTYGKVVWSAKEHSKAIVFAGVRKKVKQGNVILHHGNLYETIEAK